jgi:glycosyltransferase involved in cell wall biosynthesis
MEYITLSVCGMIAMLSFVLTARCLIAQKRIPWLSLSSTPKHPFPRISVIIPARNEERDIVASVRSVLNQEGVELEVIVVDDYSTDRTGTLVDEVARSDSRVTVLHALPLRSGWLGKCSAMQYGAAKATGDYLLFTDADILHAPTCFASAFNVMNQYDYDFLSLCPLWVNESLFEHVNIPIYFFGMAKLLAMPGLEDPASPNALASGAFMLIKAHAFHECGGFESVKGVMFDDVGFARVLKDKQYRIGYWLAPECLQVRLFKNNHDAFWGTTKNIMGAVEGHAGFAFPLIPVGIIQYWTPVFAVIFGSITVSPFLVFLGLSTYGIQYLSFFSVRRFLRFYPLKLFCFPLVVIVSTCCIFRALYYQRKGAILWRDRAIKVK